jgi:organic hydroperoxide reductase OsmC/OhrA
MPESAGNGTAPLYSPLAGDSKTDTLAQRRVGRECKNATCHMFAIALAACFCVALHAQHSPASTDLRIEEPLQQERQLLRESKWSVVHRLKAMREQVPQLEREVRK